MIGATCAREGASKTDRTLVESFKSNLTTVVNEWVHSRTNRTDVSFSKKEVTNNSIQRIHLQVVILLLLSEFFYPLLSRARFRGRCWAAIRLSQRPEPSGRVVRGGSMDWTFLGQHGRRFVLLRHTHRPQRRTYPICTSRLQPVAQPVRRRLIRIQALLGRDIPGGWVPVSGVKMRSLVGLSVHSAFHW